MSLKVTLTKSLAGQSKHRIAIANSLGLGKMHSSTIQPDNGSTRGKIRKVRDLVSVKNEDDPVDLSKSMNG